MVHRNEQQGHVQYATRRGIISFLGWGRRCGLRGLLGAFVLLGLGIMPAQAAPFAYITNTTDRISVIDTATNTVVATVPVGSFPFGVAVHPMGTFTYVTNLLSNNVSVINTATNTVVATVPVDTNPYSVAVNPAGTRVYVTTRNNVAVIDTATNTVVATVPLNFLNGVAVHPAGTFAYVTSGFDAKFYVIDTATNTRVATVPVGGPLMAWRCTPPGHEST